MCRRGDLIEAAVGGGDAAPAVAAGSSDRMIAQLRSLLAALSASRAATTRLPSPWNAATLPGRPAVLDAQRGAPRSS